LEHWIRDGVVKYILDSVPFFPPYSSAMKILLFAAVLATLASVRAGASSTGILVHGCHLQATGMKSWEMTSNHMKRSYGTDQLRGGYKPIPMQTKKPSYKLDMSHVSIRQGKN